MTIISTTVVKNPLGEIEQPSQSTRVQNAVLGRSLKNNTMISVRFQGKPFNITVIQVYALTCKAEEAEVEAFYVDLQDLHYRGLECKSRKSRNTWSNRQI